MRGILKHLLGDDQRKNLCRIGRRNDVWRNAKLERIEIDRCQEAAAFGVGLVERLRVRIVVVLNEPVRFRHLSNQILASQDIAPEAARVSRPGKQCADADDGDGDLLTF